jgi:hypothetical protein
MLEFDSFYNGFMAPYFACYRCSDTKKAIQALDIDADGSIDWNEFYVYYIFPVILIIALDNKNMRIAN